jgi:hypothetical protein
MPNCFPSAGPHGISIPGFFEVQYRPIASLKAVCRSSAIAVLVRSRLPREGFNAFVSAIASDGVSLSLRSVTGALPLRFFSRKRLTRSFVFSWIFTRVTSARYLGALSTSQPPGTRSILRPSLS